MVKIARRRSIGRKTMKKRRMSKNKYAKKMIRKSRKMRGGDISDYLPSFLTGKKQPSQQNYDMTSESNSGFGQQRVGPQPIKQYTEEEYSQFREKPNIGDKPIDEITIKKQSWF